MLETIYQAIKHGDIDTVNNYLETLIITPKTIELLNTFMFQGIKYRQYEIIKLLICTYGANPDVYNNWAMKYAYMLDSIKTWDLLLYGCKECKCEND